MSRGNQRLKDFELSYDVAIDLDVTLEMVVKVVKAYFSGKKLRIKHTFLNNPFHRHQDMTINEFYQMAWLDDGWKERECED